MLSVQYNQKGLLFTKPPNLSIPKLMATLRKSLSLTLFHFYPLAGQLNSRSVVENGQQGYVVFIDPQKGPGAKFIQAKLEITVSNIMSQTHVPKIVYSLFDISYRDKVNYDGHTMPLLSIQVTELIDGVFIGCCMNHVVGDGTSIWHFWNMWAEIHKGFFECKFVDDVNEEGFVSISRPPIHTRWFSNGCTRPIVLPFAPEDYSHYIPRYQPSYKLIDRVFHVSSKSMANLKAKANHEATNIINKNDDKVTISTFQALTALVWRAITRAKGLSAHRLTLCNLAADHRNRLHPSLPKNYFANAVQPIITTISAGEVVGQTLGWLATRLNQTVANHSEKAVHEFGRRWMEAPSFVDIGRVTSSNNVIKIGSSPRFNVYDGNEFGGVGKPVAIRSGLVNRFAGKVNVNPGCEGGGSVDVEICLMPDSMAALEYDQEFMAVVSQP